MKMRLSSRVSGVAPSATLAVAAKARELAAAGIQVVSFGTGEPDFDTPRHIREAASKALDDGLTRYPPLTGLPELRKAVVETLEEGRGLSYQPTEVLITVGAKQAIYNLCQVLLDEESEAVIVAPYWVSYPDMVRLAGGSPVVIGARFEDGFVPRVEEIEAAITERTRMLFLNSPSNPAGAMIPKETLLSLAEVLRRHPQVVVMTDDIYSLITFGDVPFVNLAMVAPDLRDRIVIVDGVSKAYAMTGWRVGWAVGPRALLDPMAVVQGQSTSGVTAFAQAGATAALRGDQGVVAEMTAEFDRRRVHMIRRLDSIEGMACRSPEGAFYALPSVEGLMGRRYEGRELVCSNDVTSLLIDEHNVAVVDGAPFGAEGFIRLSFATSMEQIDLGVDRIEDFVSKLS